jgi:hypothetical protein
LRFAIFGLTLCDIVALATATAAVAAAALARATIVVGITLAVHGRFFVGGIGFGGLVGTAFGVMTFGIVGVELVTGFAVAVLVATVAVAATTTLAALAAAIAIAFAAAFAAFLALAAFLDDFFFFVVGVLDHIVFFRLDDGFEAGTNSGLGPREATRILAPSFSPSGITSTFTP